MTRKRKDKEYLKMYEEYKKGFSLSQVGNMFMLTRQSVFIGFKRRAFELRKKKVLPYQYFNGIKFTSRNDGYYRKSNGDRELMHRYIWKFNNGEISSTDDIHHKNHDKSDNRLKNLECLSKSMHATKHNTGSNQYVIRRKN